MLERTFQLSAHGTTVRTELLAGLTTFLTMAYIIFVNPDILAAAGMPKDAVFVATCLAAELGSLIMGLYANYPIALAPGMGLNAYFAFAVVQGMGYTWQMALGAVFLSGALLWGYYWRRLLRTREFYADARAAALVGDAGVIPRAILMHKLAVSMARAAPAGQEGGFGWRLRAWGNRLHSGLVLRLPEARLLRQRLAWSPPDDERRACLADPLVALGSERTIAVSAGVAVVLLDLVQRGALTAQHIAEPAAYVPMLAGFAVFAMWTLPRVCAGQTLRGGLWRSLLLILAWFTAIKLLPYVGDLFAGTLMMITDPAGWGRAIDLWVYSMTGSLGPDLPAMVGAAVSWAQILEWHVLRPMAFFALLMPPALFLCLAADLALKERVLSWYALGGRVREVFWMISGGVALILALLVIPLLDRVLFSYVYQTWSFWEVVGMIFVIVLGLAGAVAFGLADRRWGKRCSHCGRQVDAEFRPGLHCPAPGCHQPLHGWLAASY